jgi:hypothetical protein
MTFWGQGGGAIYIEARGCDVYVMYIPKLYRASSLLILRLCYDSNGRREINYKMALIAF